MSQRLFYTACLVIGNVTQCHISHECAYAVVSPTVNCLRKCQLPLQLICHNFLHRAKYNVQTVEMLKNDECHRLTFDRSAVAFVVSACLRSASSCVMRVADMVLHDAVSYLQLGVAAASERHESGRPSALQVPKVFFIDHCFALHSLRSVC